MEKKVQKCSGNTKTSHRSWCFTSFSVEKDYWNEDKMKYLLIGTEVCPSTEKQHLQCYVVMNRAQTFAYMKKNIFSEGEHFEPCKGSFKENFNYCTKDNKYKEYGTKPSQGARSDLVEIRDGLVEGKLKVDDIILEKPELYHQYGRTLNAIEDLVMSKKYRDFMTVGIWLHGSTGVGKSKLAFRNYKPNTHYIVSDDCGWWDMYRQQNTVVINDFRGAIPYDKLLEMVDRHPYYVRRRGRPPLPFMSKVVIITSSLSPSEVYHNRHEKDDIAQLLRRFEVFNLDRERDLQSASDMLMITESSI